MCYAPQIVWTIGLMVIYILGCDVSEGQLEEVANESGVLSVNDDFLEPEFRQACEEVIPTPADVDCTDVQNAFIYLKENITMPVSV